MPQKSENSRYGQGRVYRRTVKLPDGSKREIAMYHYKFYVNGIPYRGSTHTDNWNKAQAYTKKCMAEAQAGTWPETASPAKLLMSELLDDLAIYYKLYRPKSYEHFAKPIVAHLRDFFGPLPARKITRKTLNDYIKQRLEPDDPGDAAVGQSTVNRDLSLLRRAFNLGRTNEKIHVFPSFKDLFFDESKFVRKKFFEPDDYARKKVALNDDERPVLIFGYNVGWRKQEVLTLRWDENVDFDSRTVRLWTGETKNDEGRVVSMGGPGDELYDMLVNQKLRRDTLCPECPWVFFRTNRGNRGKSTRQLGKPVVQIRHNWEKAQGVGLGAKLFHDLRRTTTRNLIRAGVSEGVAMQQTGHKTRHVFERYNIKNERDMHEARQKLRDYLASQQAHPKKG